MCINLANEQLHEFFNTHIFASEIKEYEAEGVDGAQVLFSDNR
jgi:myosin heavy subunit